MSATASLRRVGAMTLRHFYLLRSSWPRVVSLMYWPIVQMTMWGFLTVYLQETDGWAGQAFGLLLGGVLLWDVCFRSQISLSIAFLEEMWSRNLGHLFASPLRPWEWAAAMISTAAMRAAIGALPAMALCIPLFGFSIFELGWALVAFFLQLAIFGWALSLLVISIIFRHGMGADELAWAAIFLIAPFSCIYYPVSVLPDFLVPIALALPATHVFEGMRAALNDGAFDGSAMRAALVLNLIWLAAGLIIFLRACAAARANGWVLQQGE